jgi:GT2 family glycosyltransferase
MRVLVVLVNWNGWQDTLACVHSVLAHTPPWVHIAVCDNASADGSVHQLQQRWAAEGVGHQHVAAGQLPNPLSDDCRVLLADTGGNLGFAGGCNVGLRFAMAHGYDHCWLLNNDTVIDERTLPALVERMQQDGQIGLCGSTLIYFDHRDMVQAWGGASYDARTGTGVHLGVGQSPAKLPQAAEVEARMSYVVGASMFVSRAFLQQVGLMNEDYFLYYEEIDWVARAQGRFKLAWAPDSRVFHKEGASIGSSHLHRPSDLSLRYLYRNRLLFTRRHHTRQLWSVRKRLLRETISYLRRLDARACGIIARALWADLTGQVR